MLTSPLPSPPSRPSPFACSLSSFACPPLRFLRPLLHTRAPRPLAFSRRTLTHKKWTLLDINTRNTHKNYEHTQIITHPHTREKKSRNLHATSIMKHGRNNRAPAHTPDKKITRNPNEPSYPHKIMYPPTHPPTSPNHGHGKRKHVQIADYAYMMTQLF